MRAATDRPVRVTIEGLARPVVHNPSLLRVEYGTGGVLLVNSSQPGVEVEDVAEPRTWTNGDVLQHEREGWTLTRTNGRWLSSLPYGTPWEDHELGTGLVGSEGWGRLVVLRYQHGEQ